MHNTMRQNFEIVDHVTPRFNAFICVTIIMLTNATLNALIFNFNLEKEKLMIIYWFQY